MALGIGAPIPTIATAGVRIVPDLTAFRGALQAGGIDQATIGAKGAQTALAAAALGAAAFGAASVAAALKAQSAFVDYEASLTKIVTLVGISREQTDAWGQELIALGPQVGVGPQELAEALFFVTSAGLRGEEAMSALEASARGAALGLGDTATIADAVTSAVNAYGPAILDADAATDILVKTVEQGKVEADSLAGSIGRVIPIAAEAGVEFAEVGASVAALTRTGLDAEEATTALRQLFNNIINPSSQAVDALASVGLTAEDMRESLSTSLFDTLDLIRDKFGDNTEALFNLIPNIRAATGFLSLMGSQADSTANIFDEVLNNSLGVSIDRLEELQDTNAFRRQQASAAIEGIFIGEGEEAAQRVTEIYEALPGILDDIIPFAVDVGEAFLEVAQGVAGFAEGVSGIVTAIPGWVKTIGGLTAALYAAGANPIVAGITLVAGAIAAAGREAQLSRDDIERWVDIVDQFGGPTAADDIETTTAAVEDFIEAIGSGDQGFFTNLARGYGDITDNLDNLGVTADEIAEVLDSNLIGSLDASGRTILTWTDALRATGAIGPDDVIDPELASFLRDLGFSYSGALEEIATRPLTFATPSGGEIVPPALGGEFADETDAVNRIKEAFNGAAGEAQNYGGIVRGLPTPDGQLVAWEGMKNLISALVIETGNLSSALLEAVNPGFAATKAVTDFRDQYDEAVKGGLTNEEREALILPFLEVQARVDELDPAEAVAFRTVVSDAWENLGGDTEELFGEGGVIPVQIDDFGRLVADIGPGIVDNSDGWGEDFGNTMANEIDAGLSIIKSRFGISSPSRVFRDQVGLPLAQGVAAGFRAGIPNIVAAFGDLPAAGRITDGLAPLSGGTVVNVFNPREESTASGISRAGTAARLSIASS